MKKTIKTGVLLFTVSIRLLSIHAQSGNAVVIGSIDSIKSKILQEERKIWVHVPASARAKDAAKKKYPVVYLLDAEWNFSSVVGMIDLLGTVNGNSVCPELIVVGISNKDRKHDLTPTHVAVGGWIDSSMSRSSGGGEAFISFIEKELIPHIDSLYPTSPYRMLIGHSLGGLTAINTLVHHTNLFNSYVAIDPSMWWDNQKLLHETRQILQQGSCAGKTLFLGMANTLPEGMDTTTVQADTSIGTSHPRAIMQLARYIMNTGENGLQAKYKYYDGDTHTTVPLLATYDALHFIFKDYGLQFQDRYFTDPDFKLASFLAVYYENIRVKYGITAKNGSPLLPPEDVVSGLAYAMLNKKQFTKAAALFELNKNNYPANSGVYEGLGDLYAAKGDTANAISNYKRSLSIKETIAARKKLSGLVAK